MASNKSIAATAIALGAAGLAAVGIANMNTPTPALLTISHTPSAIHEGDTVIFTATAINTLGKVDANPRVSWGTIPNFRMLDTLGSRVRFIADTAGDSVLVAAGWARASAPTFVSDTIAVSIGCDTTVQGDTARWSARRDTLFYRPTKKLVAGDSTTLHWYCVRRPLAIVSTGPEKPVLGVAPARPMNFR